jgi:hypothetical protein
VLAPDDDVRPLRAFVAAVTVQRCGLFVHFDLITAEADGDQRFDEGFAVLEARLAFHVVRHGGIAPCVMLT